MQIHLALLILLSLLLPPLLLSRHGNHNYFKATFMWYHTDINDRILECPGEGAALRLTTPRALETLAGLAIIRCPPPLLLPLLPNLLIPKVPGIKIPRFF